MANMATVRAHVDGDVERRASEVLKREGLTVEEAVQAMLVRTADEGALPFSREFDASIYGDEDPAYNAWFREKVQQALDDPRPAVSRDELDRRMASRRTDALHRIP